MPAALDVDWSGIRAAAVVVGVREAARRANIPEGTVMARSKREGWMVQAQAALQAPSTLPSKQRSEAVQAYACTGADIITEAIREHSEACKVSSLRVSRKGLEHAETLDGDAILERSGQVKALTESAAKAGNWASEAGVQVGVQVNLSGLGGDVE